MYRRQTGIDTQASIFGNPLFPLSGHRRRNNPACIAPGSGYTPLRIWAGITSYPPLPPSILFLYKSPSAPYVFPCIPFHKIKSVYFFNSTNSFSYISMLSPLLSLSIVYNTFLTLIVIECKKKHSDSLHLIRILQYIIFLLNFHMLSLLFQYTKKALEVLNFRGFLVSSHINNLILIKIKSWQKNCILQLRVYRGS